MKKLLILFMAFGLITVSCNNNKGKGLNDDRNTNSRDKDDYRNKDKNEDEDDRGNTNRDREDENTGGGWSSSDKRQWMKVCSDPLKESMGEDKASSYCSCVLEKIQERYSSFNKANTQGTESEGMEMGRECLRELGYQ